MTHRFIISSELVSISSGMICDVDNAPQVVKVGKNAQGQDLYLFAGEYWTFSQLMRVWGIEAERPKREDN